MACKYELEDLHNLSEEFSEHLTVIMKKCLGDTVIMQTNFWTFHKIMFQLADGKVISKTVSDLVFIMNQKVNENFDARQYMSFLYNFRNYFQGIFFNCEDEKILVDAISALLDISISFKEILYLSIRSVKDKLIQKCLRLYMKNNINDKKSIENLLNHFLYWQEKNLPTIGGEPKAFTMDYLIQKQVEG